MMGKSSIPTFEDFERVSRQMRECAQNLDEVREAVLTRFRGVCLLHAFNILDQRDVDFRVYVFYEKEKDLELCDSCGLSRQIVDFVYAELERVGRGSKTDISVSFEFDSNENVVAHYEGNYFLRLR